MNQAGKNNLVNNAESLSISNQTNSIQNLSSDSLRLKVAAPALKPIPETPGRFKTPKAVIVQPAKVFTPTSKDSVEFNLIKKTQQDKNVLKNTVVEDYLNPISRSDLDWVEGEVAASVKPDSVYVVQIEEEKPDSVRIEPDALKTLSVTDSTSIQIEQNDSIQQTILKDVVETIAEEVGEDKEVFLHSHAKDIISGLLILSVAIVGVIRMTHYKYLRELFSSVLFSQYARKMQNTVNVRNQKAAFVLNALFLFNTSIFIYQFITYHQIKTLINESLLLIPLSMGLIFGFGIIKGGLYRFVGFVFACEKETKDYLFFSVLHNKIFALIILPIILVVPYIETEMLTLLFNIGIGSFILLYFMQLFRGAAIILNNLASLFYMFLYLCALEILPLIIMYNVLIK